MPGPSYHAWTHSPNGTDPIGLADGDEFNIKVVGDTTALTVGDGKFIFAVPADLNGHQLIDAGAYVTTTSSSGLPTVQIRNITNSNVDMLSTRITIKVGELDSYGPGSTATPPVINTSNDDVTTGDQLAIDVDVAGTGAKGLGVILVFNSDPPGTGAKGETGATGATGPPGADGADGADGAISVIEDEGTPLTVRSNVNFVGAGVTAADSGGKTVVTISGGSGPGVDGWTDPSETWTYATAATFTVSGDQTARYSKGTRLKFTQTTVKYGVVAGSVHSSGTTTVTIVVNTDYVLANAAISANYYSYAENPQGYPGWFAYAPASTGFSGTPTEVGRFSVNGKICTVGLNISGTSNAATFTCSVPVAAANNLSGGGAFWLVRTTDNGSATASGVDITRPTATFRKAINASGGFTSSGTKGTYTVFSYEI